MSGSGIRTFHQQVRKASRSTHSARAVLMEMLWNSNWSTGGRTVTITKPQIAEATGLRRESIRLGLRFLQEEGTIEIIKGGRGGRSVPVTYAINVPKGTNNQDKGTNNQDKGTNNTPPIKEYIYTMNRGDPGRATTGHKVTSGQGARQWRGRQAEKGGADGNRRALTQEEAKRLGRAMKLAGDYGAAKRLIAAWDAGEIPEGTLG